jgi:predicted porin
MTDRTIRARHRRGSGIGPLSVTLCLAGSAVLLAAFAAPVQAGPKGQSEAETGKHYQVYIGRRGETSYSVNRDWGGLRLTTPSTGGDVYSPSLTQPSGTSGVTYFTPSLSGVRIGVGVGGAPAQRSQGPNASAASQYTDLGPRAGKARDGAGNWQIGGTVGYSALELGANIGDHSDPSCSAGNNCKTNDFWDVGVALRIGSGAISAAYTASQPRGPRTDDGRIDIFSLNAGYKVGPGVNIYGGVDWIDLQNTGETAETPVDTRFMLGTNLRF